MQRADYPADGAAKRQACGGRAIRNDAIRVDFKMILRTTRPFVAGAMALVAAFGLSAPVLAQVTTVDPDTAIDADINHPQTAAPQTYQPNSTPTTTPSPSVALPYDSTSGTELPGTAAQSAPAGSVDTWQAEQVAQTSPPAPDASTTYHEDDLIGAAEGVFGKGAQGLADVIKDILKKQGEPNGYIVGREAGGAIGVGLRYGSGTLYHKIEGTQPVYWTGPSIGFDAGANASNAFILVYNLFDTEDLFHRYASGEGQAYLVGGFNVSYLRRKKVVLIPVRVGAGLRLGANVGYMKFSHKQKWLPF